MTVGNKDEFSVCERNVALARVNFILHCSDMPLLTEPCPPAYAPFISDEAVCDTGSLAVHVILRTKGFPSLEGLAELFEGRGSWSMFKKGNEYYLVINPSLPDGPECIAQFDPRSGEAAVYCGKADMVEAGGREMLRNPFTYPLDQLLLMYVLAHKEGALLHASAVDFGGRGYLFPGRSGAGKSTISRYLAAKGHEVLSDDRVAVRNMKTGFSIFGTPWSGEARIAANANLPLHGIFFVGHGSENRIEEIPPGEAARRLMPVTSIPWFDREAVTAILLFCEDLVLNVPAYDLHFIPGAEVVSFFEEFIS